MTGREERKDIPLPDTAQGASVTVVSVKRGAPDAPAALNGPDSASQGVLRAQASAKPRKPRKTQAIPDFLRNGCTDEKGKLVSNLASAMAALRDAPELGNGWKTATFRPTRRIF